MGAKFVPKFLNFEQKMHNEVVVQELIDGVVNVSTSLKRIITGDET